MGCLVFPSRNYPAFQRSLAILRFDMSKTHRESGHLLRDGGRVKPTAEYWAWGAMKRRCSETSQDRKHYYDRGITVCDRWLHSYENFLADMGRKPSPKLTLERKDNDLGYSPDNCIWDTVKNQSINRSSNRYITAFGQTKRIGEWGEQLGVSPNVIRERIDYRGWDAERAVSTPRNLRTHPKLLKQST